MPGARDSDMTKGRSSEGSALNGEMEIGRARPKPRPAAQRNAAICSSALAIDRLARIVERAFEGFQHSPTTCS